MCCVAAACDLQSRPHTGSIKAAAGVPHCQELLSSCNKTATSADIRIAAALSCPPPTHTRTQPAARSTSQGYFKAGQLGTALANVKWVTDYFIKCVGNRDVVIQVRWLTRAP